MDKKLLIAVGLSLATVWAFRWYTDEKPLPTMFEQHHKTFGGSVAVGQPVVATPGQPVKVPTTQELYKPLELDVEFADKKVSEKETTLVVETDYCIATLSNYGAVLSSLDFKEHQGKSGAPLRTVYSKGSYDEEQRKKGCFLVALDHKTPYVYSLEGKQDSEKTIAVAFATQTDQWKIQKTYVFHKDSYQIDLVLGFESTTQTATPIKPRIFLSAPRIGELSDDTVSVFSWNSAKGALETTEVTQAQGLAWFWSENNPLFGTDDRYFVHALISDESKFAQRGYVKQFDAQDVSSVLEGPSLAPEASKQEWKMSFYMGPKLYDHVSAVDDRLEEILSFGWLSSICKLLLKLLSFIQEYISNVGLAIIVMAILLKLPFAPLSIYARKKMLVYQHYLPSINKIRTKYRHDVKLQHDEMMKFYKDHGISPAVQFMGCLPLLIQMPIMFSLYRILANYLDLYQAPFFGWIVDLSAKDPFYTLPILMGLSMLWQQQLTPVGDEKQRGMMFFMALFMTAVFANFPAGLVLYWLMNNLLTIGEDYLRKYCFK